MNSIGSTLDGAATSAPLDRELFMALADDIRLLVRLHDREPDPDLIGILRGTPVDQWFALCMSGPDYELGCKLISEALSDIPSDPDAKSLDGLAADFAAIYLTFNYRAAPSESVWVDDDGLERQGPMFAVRRCFERRGFSVPDWRTRSDDHLVYQLQFIELTLRSADDPDALRELAWFMRHHLLAWAPRFLTQIAGRCREPFFAGSMLLTNCYLTQFAAFMGTVVQEDMTPVMRPKQTGRGADRLVPRSAAAPRQAYVPGLEPSW
jgi:TorA maturation chaperone TorD